MKASVLLLLFGFTMDDSLNLPKPGFWSSPPDLNLFPHWNRIPWLGWLGQRPGKHICYVSMSKERERRDISILSCGSPIIALNKTRKGVSQALILWCRQHEHTKCNDFVKITALILPFKSLVLLLLVPPPIFKSAGGYFMFKGAFDYSFWSLYTHFIPLNSYAFYTHTSRVLLVHG